MGFSFYTTFYNLNWNENGRIPVDEVANRVNGTLEKYPVSEENSEKKYPVNENSTLEKYPVKRSANKPVGQIGLLNDNIMIFIIIL